MAAYFSFGDRSMRDNNDSASPSDAYPLITEHHITGLIQAKENAQARQINL